MQDGLFLKKTISREVYDDLLKIQEVTFAFFVKFLRQPNAVIP